ncbi:MAG: hypothetical protein A2509_02025 [Candidatus Edwardsbacteria bacterium RIFOXYD12_FULL_50_11]|jgi:transcriptional regulator with XRE-family HTH domain|uniref:HTH cro/C1-type domain-containing protein n=1 Tax=Candidatus Edwardsbacteria bacterium GWF2_54_11 TaxID=1817851 RepID=A0A1F5RHQ1_9BACT|nr:MAG: hypothetical protein A2502_09465 [Candidatus Edwardsbacteria bacterium RifOxyC12_full_54_24]OGF06925.1 MAG: hypothetical protein A2273_01595 [Candidatus Edwardsbacteria bacterium RifOxyA12_full_54_48]OGF10875.1 MAG: hypothetical protein A3K15_06965 [Candidatus Edwardsbacteria bacterium GWE2_54_12]OGF13949.1 MAG: hypothetical protein A2024_11545 [Candidatus Edwardsbacteria bacterium GWF2_54_11]OGF14735.1 MAG: hypothetical protein A2509_02025 [Candidatus Edwardsbacteria bacterium RIFOXYD1
MSKISKILGQKIRYLRKAKGFTQEKLAELSGLDNTYIGAIERGQRNPSIESAQAIAKALNISLKDLFDDKQFKKNETTIKTKEIQKIAIILEKQKYHIIRSASVCIKELIKCANGK